MDYEFSVDSRDRPKASFSMGHEALARWFSEELSHLQRIDDLMAVVQKLERCEILEYQITGVEFQLRLDRHEVQVVALALGVDVDEELPEDTALYDEESYSQCGLSDFKEALYSWRAFVVT